jgi:hypothetical protein
MRAAHYYKRRVFAQANGRLQLQGIRACILLLIIMVQLFSSDTLNGVIQSSNLHGPQPAQKDVFISTLPGG